MSKIAQAKAFKIVKKKKRGTEAVNRHRFESFTERLNRLKIDPLRHAQNNRNDDALDGTKHSSFGLALESWKDSNLSTQFVRFARQIGPLGESLVQVLHNQDEIARGLRQSIETGDSHSLEPLLDLVVHFARDLGSRFEKHFKSTVQTIAQVASHHTDVAVIEWTFNCLASLFKYLYRLLIHDLRPLYDLMAPLLGKEKQKPFVARFAAESMSFLLRKTASMSHEGRTSLPTIVDHIITDLLRHSNEASHWLYQRGVMTLFATAMMGPHHGVLSSAGSVFASLFNSLQRGNRTGTPDAAPMNQEIWSHVLTAVIHHCDAEGFSLLLHDLLQFFDIKTLGSGSNIETTREHLHLLLTILCVRKGTRINDWKRVHESLKICVDWLQSHQDQIGNEVIHKGLAVIAIFVIETPLPVLASATTLFTPIARPPWEDDFHTFCYFVAEFDKERFRSVVLPRWQRYFAEPSHASESRACLLAHRLSNMSLLPQNDAGFSDLVIETLRNSLVHLTGQDLSADQRQMALARVATWLNIATAVCSHPNTPSELVEDLQTLMIQSVCSSDSFTPDSDAMFHFGTGTAWKFLSSRGINASASFLRGLGRDFANASLVPSFWEALSRVATMESVFQSLTAVQIEDLLTAAIDCMSSPSHELRLAVARFWVCWNSGDEFTLYGAQQMYGLEILEPTLHNTRDMCSRVRKLAAIHKRIATDHHLSRAIPAYCLGLLHVPLSELWKECVLALTSMRTTSSAEDVITRHIETWLSGPSSSDVSEARHPSKSPPALPDRKALSDFECSNQMQIEHAWSACLNAWSDPEDVLITEFRAQNSPLSLINSDCRSKMLYLLNSDPHLGEKHSRLIVPHFLSGNNYDTPNDQENQCSQSWTRKDFKALLALFAQFSNPRVLRRSEEVKARLISLLSNGDTEIQRHALKALGAWKDPAVIASEQLLYSLLDEDRIKDSLSSLTAIFQNESVESGNLQQALPLLLRILYGQMINKSDQQSRRSMILRTIGQMGEGATQGLLHIAVSQADLNPEKSLVSQLQKPNAVEKRKLSALLSVCLDLLRSQGHTLGLNATTLVDIAIGSANLINHDNGQVSAEGSESQRYPDKLIRQRLMHILTETGRTCHQVKWSSYEHQIMTSVVNPRMRNFVAENSQSVSGFLELISTWCSTVDLASTFLCSRVDAGVLATSSRCLLTPKTKNEVKKFWLDDVLLQLLSTLEVEIDTSRAQQNASRLQAHVQECVPTFLENINGLLECTPDLELMEACMRSVSALMPFVYNAHDLRSLLVSSVKLMGQHVHRTAVNFKNLSVDLVAKIVPKIALGKEDTLWTEILMVIAPLFSNTPGLERRRSLSDILHSLASSSDDLRIAAVICDQLNARDSTRLDEPDFEQRAHAFRTIIESDSFDAMTWRPIVFNLLYFVRDEDELMIRTNASLALRHFVSLVSQRPKDECDLHEYIWGQIFPSMLRDLPKRSDLVKIEYLAIISDIVQNFPEESSVQDLQVLCAGGDDEASFFTNVFHIQMHRRIRAISRLKSSSHSISGRNVERFLMPLLEHIIMPQQSTTIDHNLASECIGCLGALAQNLKWHQFRGYMHRYMKMLKEEEQQKLAIRLIASMASALTHAFKIRNGLVSSLRNSKSNQEKQIDPSEVPPHIRMSDQNAMESGAQIHSTDTALSSSLPSEKVLSKTLREIIEGLAEFLHYKDEHTASLRIPIALSATKIVMLLSPSDIRTHLSSILHDVSSVLKSKDQGIRDVARQALAELARIIGETQLGLLLQELRNTLVRGAHLHVLAFTVHSILVSLSPDLMEGTFDHCVDVIMDIVMEDVFGMSGQEKDEKDYTSQMKEVKSFKSLDTLEILSKHTSASQMSKLIRPIQSLLMEKLNSKNARKITEVLQRLRMGLLQNLFFQGKDVLQLCYELLNEPPGPSDPSRSSQRNSRASRYLVKIQGAARSGHGTITTSFAFKLDVFALELLHGALTKDGTLRTVDNVSGLVPLVSNRLITGNEEVQASALKVLTSISSLALSDWDRREKAYSTEVLRIVHGSSSLTTDVAQSGLKFLTSMIKDRPDFPLPEKDIATLLKGAQESLDDPQRQSAIFNFIRALIGRKTDKGDPAFMMPELYQTIDYIAEMMITSQIRSAREIARSVYFQFLLEFPQSGKRFLQQLNFLAKNLDYQHREGRQAVMECIHFLFSKIPRERSQEVLNFFFLHLCLAMGNEEDSQCYEMLRLLVRKLFTLADNDSIDAVTAPLRLWLKDPEQPVTQKLSLVCWSLLLEERRGPIKNISWLFEQTSQILDTSHATECQSDITAAALGLMIQMCDAAPRLIFAPAGKPVWRSVVDYLGDNDTSVQLQSTKLVGALFTEMTHSKSDHLSANPLTAAKGLGLNQEMMQRLAHESLEIIFGVDKDDELYSRTSQNILFLCRYFIRAESPWDPSLVKASAASARIDSSDESDSDEPLTKITAINHIVMRLVKTFRKELPSPSLSAASLSPHSFSIWVLQRLIPSLPSDLLHRRANLILHPLLNLTDPNRSDSHSFDAAYSARRTAIVESAQSTINAIRDTLGASAFMETMTAVEARRRARRDDRRVKRKVSAVRDPEKSALRKRRKGEARSRATKARVAHFKAHRRGQ